MSPLACHLRASVRHRLRPLRDNAANSLPTVICSLSFALNRARQRERCPGALMRRTTVLRSQGSNLVGTAELKQEGWAMPRFYFHIWRGGQLEADEAGVALPSLTSARRRAESIAFSILAETVSSPEPRSGWDVEVTDQTGQTVIIIPIRDRHTDGAERHAA